MEETKLQELNLALTELLTKYNCTLQVAHTIQVVPNKPMEEEVKVESEVTGTEPVETGEVTASEEVA